MRQSSWVTALCFFLVLVSLGRIQELFPFMAIFRVALTSSAILLMYFVFTGRLHLGSFTETLEAKLTSYLLLIGFVTIPFSVWRGGAWSTWAYGFTSNAGLFFCCYLGFGSKKTATYLSWSIITSAVMLALMAMSISVLGERVSASLTYDPNDLALIMVVVLPVMFGKVLVTKGLKRIVLFCLLVSMLQVLIMTGSRGGLVGLVCTSIFAIIAYFPGSKRSKRIFFLIVAGIVMYRFIPQDFMERIQAIFSGEDYNFEVGRVLIWKRTLELIPSKLFFGVGAGQFTTAMGLTSGAWKTGHNMYLQVLLDLGIFGLIVFLASLRRIWSNCSSIIINYRVDGKNRKNAIEATCVRLGLVGYMTCGFFLSQAYSVILPLFMALSCCLWTLQENDSE